MVLNGEWRARWVGFPLYYAEPLIFFSLCFHRRNQTKRDTRRHLLYYTMQTIRRARSYLASESRRDNGMKHHHPQTTHLATKDIYIYICIYNAKNAHRSHIIHCNKISTLCWFSFEIPETEKETTTHHSGNAVLAKQLAKRIRIALCVCVCVFDTWKLCPTLRWIPNLLARRHTHFWGQQKQLRLKGSDGRRAHQPNPNPPPMRPLSVRAV